LLQENFGNGTLWEIFFIDDDRMNKLDDGIPVFLEGNLVA